MLDSSIRAAFDGTRGYLDTASYGLPARATVSALHAATDAWSRGALELAAIDRDVDRIRTAFASIVGASPADIALASTVSQVVGTVAASLPDSATVLVAEHEFASVVMPFRTNPRLNVVAVPHERLVDAVGPGVDLVAVSAAQSSDGRVVDLVALAQAAQAAGVLTLIDVTQSSPWLPIDARRFDVVVAAAYKWLTAPRGITLAAVHPSATWVRPVNAGWYSADDPWGSLYEDGATISARARRLDLSPPWQLVSAGAAALDLMASIPVADARAHSTGLADEFRAALGLAPAGSAIVSLPGTAGAFAAAGLRVASRAGRVRLGFHVYNDSTDVERAVAAARRASPVAA